ncbi:MATE family efflux transporter [Psittacicella hinzii]|uniref:Multidrug resistance protein NorM n=1 Tax=Psittacicella hinzii TaxID=2028575 RepID=A0A3A1YPB5_9GAMM|nr:MATE family efflux transporter [Psittacicella hinzii]RIY39455.1 hypothetical protein CKF58_02190 [Psittacicella hinzii]
MQTTTSWWGTKAEPTNLRLFFNIFPATFASQLVYMSVVIINTLMAAHVSTTAMAAIGLVGSILWTFNSLGLGLLSVILSRMGYAYGKKDYTQVGDIHRQTYYLIGIISIFIMLIDLIFLLNLGFLNLSQEMLTICRPYFIILIFNVPLNLYVFHLRNINSCVAFTLPTLLISIPGLLLVAPLNLIFMYGDLPFLGKNPGYSAFTITVINLIYIVGLTAFIKFRKSTYAKLNLFQPIFQKPDSVFIKDILKNGSPIAMQYWLENSFYSLVAVLVTPLGTSVLAAHEAAISCYGIVYSIAIAGSATLTSITARRLGENRRDLAQQIFRNISYFLIAVYVLIGIVTILHRDIVADIFIKDDRTAHDIAQNLIIFLGASNFFDGLYAALLGYIIPYRDSRYAFLTMLIVAWGLGMPLANTLAFTSWLSPAPMGIYGFWTTFVIVAFIICMSFLYRIIFKWHRISDEELKIHLNKGAVANDH